MTPLAARSERPETPRKRIGKPFGKGNSGRPKGVRDKRTLAGVLAAQALESRAWDVLESLLTGRSGRVKLEAARTVLAYACGLPRQTLELSGGLSDLAGELARALAEVRSRHAALPAVGVEEGARRALSAGNAQLSEVRNAPPLVAELVSSGEPQAAPGAVGAPDTPSPVPALAVATGAQGAVAPGTVADPAEEVS